MFLPAPLHRSADPAFSARNQSFRDDDALCFFLIGENPLADGIDQLFRVLLDRADRADVEPVVVVKHDQADVPVLLRVSRKDAQDVRPDTLVAAMMPSGRNPSMRSTTCFASNCLTERCAMRYSTSGFFETTRRNPSERFGLIRSKSRYS